MRVCSRDVEFTASEGPVDWGLRELDSSNAWFEILPSRSRKDRAGPSRPGEVGGPARPILVLDKPAAGPGRPGRASGSAAVLATRSSRRPRSRIRRAANAGHTVARATAPARFQPRSIAPNPPPLFKRLLIMDAKPMIIHTGIDGAAAAGTQNPRSH